MLDGDAETDIVDLSGNGKGVALNVWPYKGNPLVFNSAADFPIPGDPNSVYVEDTTEAMYRWDTNINQYVEISPPPTAMTPDMMAMFNGASVVGKQTPGPGPATELSGGQITTLLPDFATANRGVVPASGGGSVNFLRADGTWAVPPSILADNSVTFAKMQDVGSGTVFYRKSAGTGDPETQTLATLKTDLGLTGTNSGDQTITLTGDVTGSGTGSFATAIGAGKVTLAMQANVNSGTVFYRKTAAAGAPETQTLATLKTDLGLTGTNSGDQTITLTGDITGSGTGSFNTTIGASKVTTGMIADNNVTFAKLADINTATFVGRSTAGTGDPEVLTATQATALLNTFTSSLKGLCPPGTGTSDSFLAGDGVFRIPSVPAGSVAWGAITGTMSAQTDLNTALNGKASLTGAIFTGDITVPAEAYGAGWSGSNEAPTKNDLYTKIEAITGVGGSSVDMFDYNFSASTSAPPGTNQIRTNNAAPASVTRIWIDGITLLGFDPTNYFLAAEIGDKIAVQDKNEYALIHRYTLTAVPTRISGYIECQVTSIGGSSTNWNGGQPTCIAIIQPDALETSADIISALGYTPANKAGETFGGAISATNLSGTNTGDQTTITGNAGTATALQNSRNFSITGGGITAAAVGFNGTANVTLSASVDAGHITLTRMANLGANSIIGNNTGVSAVPLALTATQVTAMLDLASTTAKGVVAPPGGTTSFLRADGTWAAPPGGVDDTAYGVGWNGSTTLAPSQNAVYDKIAALAPADINVATGGRVLGKAAAGAGTCVELTSAQLNSIIGQFATASTSDGLVPGSNSGGVNAVLRGDRTWGIPIPKNTSTTSNANLTPNCAEDMTTRSTQTVGLTINAPTGTPTVGLGHVIKVKSAAAQSITWNAIYQGISAALPTTTVAGKWMYFGFIYNDTDSKWDMVSNVVQP